jgi:glyceraldehyde 3-phosphate dehydrogenase/D-erythrose 4-phosphate dehydrogenase
VPLLDLLDREVGIEQALLTTLHSVMNDQPLIDGYHHDDLRRTRSAMQSIIPVSTGLARGIERLLPQLAGRSGQGHPRADHQCLGHRPDPEHPAPGVGAQHQRRCSPTPQRPAQGLIAYSEAAHASIDFNHDPIRPLSTAARRAPPAPIWLTCLSGSITNGASPTACLKWPTTGRAWAAQKTQQIWRKP